jgi:hypothetical protein
MIVMAAPEFKFIEAYRKSATSAPREIVEARQKGHDKLYPLFAKSMPSIYAACRLAFQLQQEPEGIPEWFEVTIREFDSQFSLEIDAAEASRIASLLLRDLMARGSPHGTLAVLISSYTGRRPPIDVALLVEAHDAINRVARDRRIILAERKITPPPVKDLKNSLDPILQNWSADTVRTAFNTVVSDYREATMRTAASATEAHASLRSDVIRLAEEVDMLWWHIGDWSETFDRPRSDLAAQVLGIVSGLEIAEFVRQIPGPYGAYGILRRILTKTANEKITLKAAVSLLGEDVNKVARQLPHLAMPLFPIHTAMQFASEHNNADSWPIAFETAVSGIKDLEVPHFDLAVQSFRERLLINYGGLA